MASIRFFLTLVVALWTASGLAHAQDRPISPGVPVSRSISGQDVHTYTFQAARNHVVTFVALQKGVDVTVRLLAPNGATIAERDSPNGADGPEQITAIAEAAGTYRVEVRKLVPHDPSTTGVYEALLVEVRPATPKELERHAVEKELLVLEQQ